MAAYILKGAYGRKYETKTAAIADWEAGKDFLIDEGPAYVGSYCSIRDAEQMGEVWLWYSVPIHQGMFSPEVVRVR